MVLSEEKRPVICNIKNWVDSTKDELFSIKYTESQIERLEFQNAQNFILPYVGKHKFEKKYINISITFNAVYFILF